MQKSIKYTEGVGIPHKTFEDEFLSHRKCSEWWYSTGYFTDENGKMYTYQYTLANVKILGIRMHMLLTSITDLENQKHYYTQDFSLFGKGVRTDQTETSFGDKGVIKYTADDNSKLGHMHLSMKTKNYTFQAELKSTKKPVWHCEDGKLQMGIQNDPKEQTYYFSLTNLMLNGILTLEGQEHRIKGKAWYDKQGGTYSLTNYKTNWEWFSLRFFDDEEIMLFYFPQNEYKDGTYININGDYERLNNYSIEIDELIVEKTTNYKFSNGWKIHLPHIKETDYILKPKISGQFNVFFFELLADIIDTSGNLVGYCFVELLPGARNKKIHSSLAFKKN